MRILPIATLVLLLMGFPVSGCSDADREADDERLSVFVSIPPQAFFAERIGGKHVKVNVLVPPDQTPHTYEPTIKQITRLAGSDVYFVTGLPFENEIVDRLQRSAPMLRIVNVSGQGEFTDADRNVEDTEHSKKIHDHETHDPHTWLSPEYAMNQSRRVAEILITLDPENRETYQNNLETLLREIRELDREIAQMLAPYKGRTFYVFHPAFGHFAQEYGLTQKAVEVEGKSPAPKEMRELIESARRDNVKVIFVQPQFADRAAKRIALRISGNVVSMDPLARDYLANMRRIAQKIRDAFTGATTQEGAAL